jgi:hypothetical protein
MTTVLIRAALPNAPEVSSPAPRARLEARAPARALGGLLVRVGGARAALPPDDIVDQWGVQSFPASDPPANW